MTTISTEIFDGLVRCFFGPLAQQAGLLLVKLRDGIYEIVGQGFRLRVRRGTGHRKDFVVTLSAKEAEAEDLDDLRSEIGLGVIAEYNGHPLKDHPLDSIDEWRSALDEAADAARAFCLPYLLGNRTDLDGVKRFIDAKVEQSEIQTKKYHFPKNVREEWI